MLVDGQWVEDWKPMQKADEKGRFVRQVSGFRNWITPDGSAGPTGEAGFKAAGFPAFDGFGGFVPFADFSGLVCVGVLLVTL